MAPALLLLAGVFLVPLIFTLSFSLDTPPSAQHYVALVGEPLFQRVLGNTLTISLQATALTVLIAYPAAFHLALQPPRRRALLMALVMLPFWTSILVKSFAFIVLLGDQGVINRTLRAIFGSEAGVTMLFNRVGVMIGLTHYLVPFVILPVLASLLGRNQSIERAMAVMGAGPVRIFWNAILPASLPGLLAGTLMSLTLSLGFFVTPALLGGRQDMMIANLIDFYTREVLDWPTASAISIILLCLSGLLITALLRAKRGESLL
ncbi:MULTISPECIES: ABC transporter permease [unclassified Bradyrhizobium]|uniref:ABC transporter permease n=1 Tax=unclassified Bradyrhizobium TaxID=2631580 RepID=UPI0020B1C6A3|nr:MULTISPECIES: ABC transporter permease [unclassified Bradyrhizobium]MCP3379892.1 ABC transporter permease [Bradyrhizobium sp. CCGUVB4N]MCP3440725.1 ABC transporter permease [Bradyrhizobium sp. CCGUVB14]MCP3473489.1 ABC transporter permease [Bradyrhizobium sp. CCGUVB1N3]